MRRTIAIALVALMLLAVSPVAATSPRLPTQPISEADAAVIDQTIAGLMARYPDIPAWYVGVWDPERGAYQQAYGLADVANERAARIDDHFRIGSIIKTLMATVMLMLVDDGVIGLDATVAEADPDLAASFPGVADVRIRDLLAMTSGIPDYATGRDGITAALVQAPDTRWESMDLIRAGAEQGLAPVGTSGYSTTNFVILQEIAETLTGRPIQELIREMVTEPLGMTDTLLPYNEDTALPEPRSQGYLRRACVEALVRDGAVSVPAGTDTTDWNASYGQSGGGMHSTIADLGVWAASMSGNALLADSTAQERLETHPLDDPFHYGLGIIELFGQWGHGGEVMGWQGWAGHNPATGLTVVVFVNSCAALAATVEVALAVDPWSP